MLPRHPHVGAVLALLLGGAASAGRAEEAARLVLEPAESLVEVAVKATVDSFTARLKIYALEVTVDPATRAVTQATFAFGWTDLQTGKEGRDREMHRWQDSEHFPGGRFVLAQLRPTAAGGLLATGTLELHGVSQEISFPLMVTGDGRRFALDGEAVLDTRTFGLPVIRKFALLRVDPRVVVRFHLQGHLPATP